MRLWRKAEKARRDAIFCVSEDNNVTRSQIMNKYLKKYRVNTTRLPDWDYAEPGGYFVTVCVKDQKCVFGEVRDDCMVLNDLGREAERCLLAVPEHFPFASVDLYVVMPNHVHAVIEIRERGNVKGGEITNKYRAAKYCGSTNGQVPSSGNVEAQNSASLEKNETSSRSVEAQNSASLEKNETSSRPVETQHFASLRKGQPKDQPMNHFGPQSGNLGAIVRGFKVGVTKYANVRMIPFAWQTGYHDHVIRNEADMARVQEYIVNNPLQWALDEENPERRK